MVTFTCERCNESLKKQQIEKHRSRCGWQSTFACLDCNVRFEGDGYQTHIKCISEQQKYGGKNFVVREAKGEVKQNEWTEQVQRAIAACGASDRNLQTLLNRLLDYPNVPRKEKKFNNFVGCSLNTRDPALVARAWTTITAAAANGRDAASTTAAGTANQMSHTNGEQKDSSAVTKRKASAEDDEQPTDKKSKGDDDLNNTTVGDENTKPFKWKKAIRQALKQNGQRMRIKKLKYALREQLRDGGVDDEEFNSLFDEKLQKCTGVESDGKFVLLKC